MASNHKLCVSRAALVLPEPVNDSSFSACLCLLCQVMAAEQLWSSKNGPKPRINPIAAEEQPLRSFADQKPTKKVPPIESKN